MIHVYYGGIIVNRTYVTHKKIYIYIFLLTICGPIYDDPPYILIVSYQYHIYQVPVCVTCTVQARGGYERKNLWRTIINGMLVCHMIGPIGIMSLIL